MTGRRGDISVLEARLFVALGFHIGLWHLQLFVAVESVGWMAKRQCCAVGLMAEGR